MTWFIADSNFVGQRTYPLFYKGRGDISASPFAPWHKPIWLSAAKRYRIKIPLPSRRTIT
jgi:hypothetical protein